MSEFRLFAWQISTCVSTQCFDWLCQHCTVKGAYIHQLVFEQIICSQVAANTSCLFAGLRLLPHQASSSASSMHTKRSRGRPTRLTAVSRPLLMHLASYLLKHPLWPGITCHLLQITHKCLSSSVVQRSSAPVPACLCLLKQDLSSFAVLTTYHRSNHRSQL